MLTAVPQGWLFTVDEPQTPVAPGKRWELWTEPPMDHATGDWRRRNDGDPFAPAWGPGDVIVTYHPDSGRCVALLDVVTDPDWRDAEGLFWLETRVRAWDDQTGPTLADIGVAKALQGGRHRLSDTQFRRAEREFGVAAAT
jgi:hypothetical protein